MGLLDSLPCGSALRALCMKRNDTSIFVTKKGQVCLVDGVTASKYALFSLPRRGGYSVFHVTLISASPVREDETHQTHCHNI